MDRSVKFCSIACSNKSRSIIRHRICKFCGDSFVVPNSHPKQKYCSTKCRDKARSTLVAETCANCGKPTVRNKSRSDKLNLAFCSKECNQSYRKAHPISGKDHVQFIERTEYHCNYCGKSVYRLPSSVKKYVFCDVECRLQWQKESGYMEGENSPTWLGGHEDHRGNNWRRQRRSARKRDKFTCQRCGVTEKKIGKSLDVHHIKPWRDFNGDWEVANHLNNLVSLCASCHQIVEWESGSKAALSASTNVLPASAAQD